MTADEIVAREQSERAALLTGEQLQALLETVPVILFALDADGVFTLSEGRGLLAIGRTPGEFVGRSIFNVFRDHPATLEIVRRALRGETVQSIVTIEGLEFDVRYQPLRRPDGVLDGLIGVALDITERHHLEDEVRRERDLALQIMNSMGQGLTLVDAEGRFEFVNAAYARMIGRTSEELIGKTPFDVTVSEDAQRLTTAHQARLRGETTSYETRFVRPDGHTVHALVTGTPRLAEGRHIGTIAVITDLTEKERAEQAIRASEAYHRSVLETALDAIITIDPDSRIVEFNPSAEAMFGYRREDVLGRPVEELIIPPALREAHRQGLSHYLATGEGRRLGRRIETTAVRAGGEEFPVELALARAGTEDAPLFTGYLRDITDAQARALLEERERIAMDLHDGVIQSLYAVSLGLSAYEAAAKASPGRMGADEAIERAVGQISGVIQDIRNYIFDLRPERVTRRSLADGVRALVEELRVNALVHTVLDLNADVDELLPPNSIRELLHLIREAASNVIRHAGATRVTIRTEQVEDRLVVSISDNGRGYQPGGRVKGRGQGMRNMKERAHKIGGRVTIASVPGQGTDISVEIPLRGSQPYR